MNDVKNVLVGYLEETLNLNVNEIEPGYQLLENGLIDSLDIVQLIAFLEEKFGITLVDNDFDISNFSTIESMVSFIEGKTAKV